MLTSLLNDNRPYWVELLIVMILGLSIRLMLLGSKSLWLDEALGLQFALAGQQALWTGQTEFYHPPLYLWLLEWWTQFGRSEFNLRLLAVVPSTFSIPALYLLAKDWLDRDVAMSAATLMAFSPLLVWYAQESRPYALLSFLGLLIALSVNRLLQQPKTEWWLLFVSVMTAALYLHYSAVLLIPLQAVLFISLLASKRASWSAAAYWLAGLVVSLLAWWPWLQTPAFHKFSEIVTNNRSYLTDLVASRLGISPGLRAILFASIVVGFLISLCAWYVFNGASKGSFSSEYLLALPKQNWARTIAGILFLLLLVGSVVPRGYSLKRQIVLFWPYVLLLFAWFWPWHRRSLKWLASMLLLSLIASVVNIVAIPKPQWREVNAFITQHQLENDIVLLEPSYMKAPFDYYNEGRSKRLGLPFGFESASFQALLDANERLWLIIHQADFDPEQKNVSWLDEHAILVDSVQLYRLQIRLYES